VILPATQSRLGGSGTRVQPAGNKGSNRPATSERVNLEVIAGHGAAAEQSAFTSRRPTVAWLAWVAVVIALQSLMPAVHLGVFGKERVTNAAITLVESNAHAELGAVARSMVEKEVMRGASVPSAASQAALTLLAVVLSALVLHASSILFGADLSAKRALSIAAKAAAGVVVLRCVGWLSLTLALGLDQASAVDWMHVAPAHLGWLASADIRPVALTLLGSADVYNVVGAALTTLGVLEGDPQAPLPVALASGSVWPVIVALYRLGVSALLGIPIL
jgi:hypothetical protein